MVSRTTICLDDEYDGLKSILKTRGVTNLSEVVRDLLVFLAGDGETELTKTQIRELIKQFSKAKLAELRQQQKITGETEEERQQLQEFREKRQARVRAAVESEIARIGEDRFKRYILDPHGDYAKIQEDKLTAISQECGITVELSDVLAVTGWRLV